MNVGFGAGWQGLVTGGLVAWAVGYVMWRGVRLLRKRRSACGGCEGCTTGNAASFVPLESLERRTGS